MYSVCFKKISRSDSIIRHSSIFIRHSKFHTSAASGRERPVWSEKKLCSFWLWERFASSELVDHLTAIARLNRGWKPLPLAINHSLKDIELNVVSYEI